METSSTDMCEGRSALRGPHSSNSYRHAALTVRSVKVIELGATPKLQLRQFICSRDGDDWRVSSAVWGAPKVHGVDDSSPGQTRRSAQKLTELDGKTW